VRFGYDEETAVNNSFQKLSKNPEKVQENALKEFDCLLEKLESKGMNILVIDDTEEPFTPNSIFPNNWISTHEKDCLCLYPMFANNRRLERKPHILDELEERFVIKTKIDLTNYENHECYLEGTGSMVLDRVNRIVYASLSPRTSKEVLEVFCQKMNYSPVIFSAVDQNKEAIYHTNVMMSVADEFAIVCLQSIQDNSEREALIDSLISSGKTIIEIDFHQMNSFAGNALQLTNSEGKTFLAMSTKAYNSLTKENIETIEQHEQIVHSAIPTIEENGGGSVRCMLAEIFLTVKS